MAFSSRRGEGTAPDRPTQSYIGKTNGRSASVLISRPRRQSRYRPWAPTLARKGEVGQTRRGRVRDSRVLEL